jgi:hypothetical protein
MKRIGPLSRVPPQYVALEEINLGRMCPIFLITRQAAIFAKGKDFSKGMYSIKTENESIGKA